VSPGNSSAGDTRPVTSCRRTSGESSRRGKASCASGHVPAHVTNLRGQMFGGFVADLCRLVALFTVRAGEQRHEHASAACLPPRTCVSTTSSRSWAGVRHGGPARQEAGPHVFVECASSTRGQLGRLALTRYGDQADRPVSDAEVGTLQAEARRHAQDRNAASSSEACSASCRRAR